MKPIEEWHEPTLDTFRAEIRPRGRPAVLRGAAKDWPAVALGRQSPEALLACLKPLAGGAEAEALYGPPSIGGYLFYRDDMRGLNFARSRQRIGFVLDKLAEFAAAAEPPALALQSLHARQVMPGFDERNRTALVDPSVGPRLWIGNAVTVAPHFDLSENIACVVAGRRRFTLFPPDQLPNLYVGPFDFSPAGAPVSMVDHREPDLDRYPRYREALEHAETTDLAPGDAIYIPYMWWHGVQSLEPINVLANYWWNETPAAGSPFDALIHAFLIFSDMPEEQRAIWRGMLGHYVFKENGEPLAHLAPEYRGALGGVDAEGAAAIRATIARNLAGR